jgi:hypothetical protein
MAQQGPFSSTGAFFVRSRGGDYYPATFLTYADGTPVVDSVLANGISPYDAQELALYADKQGTVLANPGHYMVVPLADFMNGMYSRGQIYGSMLPNDFENAKGFLVGTFAPKIGFGDPQYQGFREGAMDWFHYGRDQVFGSGPKNTRNPRNWISAFTNAGNYGVGVFFQGAGQPNEDALRLFGDANRREHPDSASYPFGNSPWGYAAINQGYSAIPTQASWKPQSGPSAAPASTPFEDRWKDASGRSISDLPGATIVRETFPAQLTPQQRIDNAYSTYLGASPRSIIDYRFPPIGMGPEGSHVL